LPRHLLLNDREGSALLLTFTNKANSIDVKSESVAPEQVSTALSLRLKQARTAQQLSQQLVKSASEHRQKEDQAVILRDTAMARLKPLFDRSRVQTVEALREAVTRSGAARALNASIEMAESAVAESGDSMSLPTLEAEASAEDLTTITVRIDTAISEQVQQQATRDSLLLEKREAETRRATIHGQDDAAIEPPRDLSPRRALQVEFLPTGCAGGHLTRNLRPIALLFCDLALFTRSGVRGMAAYRQAFRQAVFRLLAGWRPSRSRRWRIGTFDPESPVANVG
jgi:hypothetical protein